ncbi:hypothetical protein IWW43_005506, partial [Coemansia sp. RSA 1935]
MNERKRSSSRSNGESGSALDVYRQWLDEASGSESDDEASPRAPSTRRGMDIARATPSQSPEDRGILKPVVPHEPQMISPRLQLHARSNRSTQAKPQKPQRPQKLQKPQKLMQTSFRSMLSPSPQIPAAQKA